MAACHASRPSPTHRPMDDNSTAPSPRREALARMCRPMMHFRSDDGAQAATIFAASNAFNETRLWYSLDNATGGSLHKFTAVDAQMRSERLQPPVVLACGAKPAVVHRGCQSLDHTLVCHIRFAQPVLCGSRGVHLHWRNRGVNARFSFCVEPVVERLPLAFAAACAPFFLNTDVSTRPASLARLLRWLESMSAQVGRIKLHSLNRAGDVRAALDAKGALTQQVHDRLAVKYWDYMEKTKSVLIASSHLANPFTTEEGRVNPYSAHDLVFTKCLCEERDDAEWTLIMDVDEYWTSLPPAPMLTLTQFLRTLPPTLRQYHFCAVNQECHRRTRSEARAKTATRTGARDCEPVIGLGHFSLPLAGNGQPSRCHPRLGPNSSWNSMESHCTAALGNAPILSYFLSHESSPTASPTKEQVHQLLREAMAVAEQRACIEAQPAGLTPEGALGKCTPERTRNRLGAGWDEVRECRYGSLLAPERAPLSWPPPADAWYAERNRRHVAALPGSVRNR